MSTGKIFKEIYQVKLLIRTSIKNARLESNNQSKFYKNVAEFTKHKNCTHELIKNSDDIATFHMQVFSFVSQIILLLNYRFYKVILNTLYMYK